MISDCSTIRRLTDTHVLLVEDDEVVVIEVRGMLKKAGITNLTIEKSVRGAVESFSNERFDLVLLDWLLPDIPGTEFLKHVRLDDTKTPIIMITGRGEREQVMTALELGCTDYIVKPLRIERFLGKVLEILDM